MTGEVSVIGDRYRNAGLLLSGPVGLFGIALIIVGIVTHK